MRSLKKSILALSAFFVLAVALAACGSSSSGVGSKDVASVAGNPITLQAWKHWMYVAEAGNAQESQGSPVIVPNDPPKFTGCLAQVKRLAPSALKTSTTAQLKQQCKSLFTSLNSTVMDFLIKGYWYQAEAKRLGIKVTPAQVNTEFTKEKNQEFKTAAAFNSFLKETGQTLADLKFRVLVDQLFAKLEARHKVSTSAATISAYYASHKSQFGSPETRDIRIVLTKTAAAAASAKAALGAAPTAATWKTVAAKYSTDAQSKNSGGLLTGITNGQEEAALNKPAFSAPVNKVEGVIKGTFGYYVFEVTKITASTVQSLTQATPLIKEILQSQAQTTEEKAVDKAAKANWGSSTVCKALYTMDDCKGYKAPKSSTSTSATSATAPSSETTVPSATSTVSTAPTATTTAPTATSTAPTATTSTAPASTSTASTATTGTTP